MKLRPLILLIVVLAVGAGSYAAWKYTRTSHKNVLVLMFDTTRADHLGAYGYQRATSPTIDRFAEENVRYAYAVTAAPWTPPSVASMFTGFYPATHGWMPPNLRDQAKKMAVKLDPQLETLAEVFRSKGYATVGVSPNPWITQEFGFDQGFETFYAKERMVAEEVVKAGIKFIGEAQKSGKPFFAYLHFLDPHDPYSPPGAFHDAFTDTPPGRSYAPEETKKVNLYDGEILYLDSQIERLFSHLKEQGLYEDLSIIIVGDHGEQFMEHGNQGHGHQLYNEELHVPLIVKSPKHSEPKVIEVTASTVDIFRTALAAADLSTNADSPSISLFDEEALEARRGVLSEIERLVKQRSFTTSDGIKLIVQDNGDSGEEIKGLFDWRKDYTEMNPGSDAELVATLKGELGDTLRFALDGRVQGDVVRGQIKDSTIEQLKTLGYLQ
jgi:arylsulfatase A-like enzyme